VLNPWAPPGKEEKYARVERERRFVLAGLPHEPVLRTVAITDRYLLGTRIRLRRAVESESLDGRERLVYKLSQKVPGPDGRPGLITTMYLDEAEYRALAALPAAVLHKIRHSVPPCGVDMFGGALKGLYIAEAEFDTDEEMAAFKPPAWVEAEVTADVRFSGGRLADTSRQALEEALADYGLRLEDPGVTRGDPA
jgi:hypothetical protein